MRKTFLILAFTLPVLLLGLLRPVYSQTETPPTPQEELCDCLVNIRYASPKNLEKLAEIDSLLAAGAKLNKECSISKKRRNLLSDGLSNLGRGLKDAFTGKRTPKKKTYSSYNTYVLPASLALNDTAIVRALVRRGADPKLRSRDAVSVMEYFIEKDNTKAIKMLFSEGHDASGLSSISSTDESTLDLLLANGADTSAINVYEVLRSRKVKALTEKYDLHYDKISCENAKKISVGDSSIPTFKTLLEKGFPKDCVGDKTLTGIFEDKVPAFYKQKYTARSEAEVKEILEFIDFCKEKEISLEVCSTFGKSPASEAAAKGYVNILKALQANGVNLTQGCTYTSRTVTPLSEAREALERQKSRNNTSAIERLNEVIAFLADETFKNGNLSPEDYIKEPMLLSYSQKHGVSFSSVNCSTVKRSLERLSTSELIFLLENGLPPSCCTPSVLDEIFDGAIPYPNTEAETSSDDLTALLEALKTSGISINYCDNFYDNPLSIAADKTNLEIVKVLLQAGANPTPPCKEHQTPIYKIKQKIKFEEARKRAGSESEKMIRCKKILELLEARK